MVYKKIRGWTSGWSLQIPVSNFFLSTPRPYGAELVPQRARHVHSDSFCKSLPISNWRVFAIFGSDIFVKLFFIWFIFILCKKLLGEGEALSPPSPSHCAVPVPIMPQALGRKAHFSKAKFKPASQMPLSLLYVLICSLHFLILKSILFCFVKIELKNSKGSM